MNRSNSSKLIVVFIILLAVLLCLILLLINAMSKNGNLNSGKVNVIVGEDNSISSIIQEYDSELMSQDNNNLYINFGTDLYDQGGMSNKEFFEKMINALIPFFNNEDFFLIDNEKSIKITVQYDYKDRDYKIIYNGINDFYAKTDGKAYVAVDSTEIVDSSLIFIKDYYLDMLYMKDSYFSSIKDKLGEGVESSNNYTDYLNGTLSIRLAPNKVVKNIIYKNGYEGEYITDGVTMDTSLEDIYSQYGEPAFGGIGKGFLGYRNRDFYIYYYNDEISIYVYAYQNNSDFEKILATYIENKDLNEFVTSLTKRWRNYDYFNYDEENGKVQLIYASRGIEININDNESNGIILYSNYYFTNTTKSYVKNGYVTLKDQEDLINIIETKRRNNTLDFE